MAEDIISDGHINIPHLNGGDFFKMFITDPKSSEMEFKIYEVLTEQDLVKLIEEVPESGRHFYSLRYNFLALKDEKGDRGIYQKFLVDRSFVTKVDKPDGWI